MPGEPPRFGPYVLERRLGAGGMAETFVAVRSGPAGFVQRVCLKRILPAHQADPLFAELFLREARVAASVRHQNVVQVVDFGDVDGTFYLAFELVDGTDLRALLDDARARGERLPHDAVVQLALDLLAALDVAHAVDATGQVTGVVHRDLSPTNVLLSVHGEVKLADFGIAKPMGPGEVTRSEVLKGKIPYMAPEYALRGKSDARTDLFALGVMLYEVLAGVRPFDGATDVETLVRITQGGHKPLAAHATGAPDPLVDVVESLLAHDAAARPRSAGEVLARLAALAPPPTLRRALGARVRRAAARDGAVRTPSGAPAGRATAGPDDVTRTRAAPPEPGALAHPDATTEPGATALRARELATLDTAPREGRARRRRSWLLAGAVLGVAGVLTVLATTGSTPSEGARAPAREPTVPTTADEPPPRSADDTSWSAGEPRDPPTAPTPARAAFDGGHRDRAAIGGGGPLPPDAPAARRAARTALRVIVYPFGRAWIDGRSVGEAPVTVPVEPGPHRVSAGRDRPTMSQPVDAPPGRTTEVFLRL